MPVPLPLPLGRCRVTAPGAGKGGVRRGQAEVPLSGACEAGRARRPPAARGCRAVPLPAPGLGRLRTAPHRPPSPASLERNQK